MIKHVSIGKFKEQAEGRTKQENLEKARQLSLKLKAIPGLQSIEIGFNFMQAPNACDFVSSSEYADMDAVKAVVAHPLHDELVAFLKKATEASYSVTYEV